MKTTMQKIMMMVMMVFLPALYGAVQATAVDYKNTYRNTAVMQRPMTIGNQTSTAPSATFRSTSAMPTVTGVATTSTLNEDGTVNEETYGIGRHNAGQRRDKTNPSNPVVDEEDDEGNVPIGDTLIPLLLLACAYIIIRARRRFAR